ncbi:MAG TPA: T9SS type A sorting domain-containing protein [Hymenobacter sp.]
MLLLTLLGSFGSLQRVLAQSVIFNASPTAKPGEAISLQGSFGANAQAFLSTGNSSAGEPMPVLIKSAGQTTVQIPTNLGLDLYQVWIQERGQRTASIYVNQARGMHFDSPEVIPGGTVRLFGRNLQMAAGTAQVRFVAQNGGAGGGTAQVNTSKSDAYMLSLTVPSSLQPGIRYDVFVTNGLGGSAGETKAEQSLTAIANGTDYFNLGVPWAVKFDFYGRVYNVKNDSRLSKHAIGNGQANDQAAIQEAIDKAAADGGGVVYLPAGTYKLAQSNGICLFMKNRVIIKGDNRDQTIIKFGYGTAAVDKWGLIWEDTQQAGLVDLSLINVNESGNWVQNMTGKGTELFMQRIRFDLNVGDWLWWANSNKVAITNSDFIQGVDAKAGFHGPLQLNDCANFLVANNNVTYAVDGINLNGAHEGVFENNNVYRDGSARYPTNITNHVLVLNFAENVAVINNLFKVINGPAQNSNDGETIIAEGGGGHGLRIDEDAGEVSSATPTTLQAQNRNWGPMTRKPVVAIVSGTGMGQFRTITSRSGSTLNVDRPWDVLPTAGSHYAIFNWGSRNWLVKGNWMEGNRRGVTLYQNATLEVAIVENKLLNSGSIDLTPWQMDNTPAGVPQEFLPMYNNQIIGNDVANIDGSNGVFIGVHTVQHIQPKSFGTSVLNLEIRNNIVTAHVPNVPAIVDAPFPEGYLNYLEYHPMSNYIDEQVPALLGTIFQNNTAKNCDNALYLNPGSFNTLVCNMKLERSANMISDQKFDGSNRTSSSTATSCVGTAVLASTAAKNLNAAMNVYPNPTQGAFTLEYSASTAQTATLTLTDGLGRQVQQKTVSLRTGTNQVPVQATNLSKGLYQLILITANGERQAEKVMVN